MTEYKNPMWEQVDPEHSSVVRCTHCGHCEEWSIVADYNFCPWCGIRMYAHIVEE